MGSNFLEELFERAIDENGVLGDVLLDGDSPERFAEDDTGHDHKGKGKGGGQFVAKGKGGDGGAKNKPSGQKKASKTSPDKPNPNNRGGDPAPDAYRQHLQSLPAKDLLERRKLAVKEHALKRSAESAGVLDELNAVADERGIAPVPDKPPAKAPEPPPTPKPARPIEVYDPSKPVDKRIGAAATADEHAAVLAKAQAKFTNVPQPTEEEAAEARAGVEKLGANKYRKNLVGNSKDRERRRAQLLSEFGDGKVCPCLYCGAYIGDNVKGSLEQDKIITTVHGGRYRAPNLVPSCADCNKKRSDMPFEEAIEKVVKHVG